MLKKISLLVSNSSWKSKLLAHRNCLYIVTKKCLEQIFLFATREDVCWVPDINAILVVDTPVPSTQSGRRYRLSTSDLTNIERVPIEQFLIIQFNSKLKINSILPFSITLKFKHNVFVF